MRAAVRYRFSHALVLIISFSLPHTQAAQDSSWPCNAPPHVRYNVEDVPLMKRDDDILRRLKHEHPTEVKKMSSDPEEMFFLHYWTFNDNEFCEGNSSTLSDFTPPLALHNVEKGLSTGRMERYLRRSGFTGNLFSQRDFVCPSGTSACTSIDRPIACCPNTSTCQIVLDTGLGDVGCCDAAETCAGSLSQCPSGYTSCPVSIGGGCCLPGYECFQEGCALTSTTVVFVSPTPTSTSSSIVLAPSTIIDTTTVIITPSTPSSSSDQISPTPTTTSGGSMSSSDLSTSTTCASGSRSCPVSLGGGCCATDMVCAPGTCTPATSTVNPVPPVRGTSSSELMGPVSGCPTGFYACSAYNPGGCCQVDRDCRSTSCPVRSGVTIVDSRSITIVAPTGTSLGPLTGACATGWTTCDASLGGGCCPSGFACGMAACTASPSGMSATQAKVAPNMAGRARNPWQMSEMVGTSGVIVVAVLLLA